MATGGQDVSQTGVLKEWNYRNITKYYPGKCGRVEGSTGEMYPPKRHKNETLEVFFHDICRPMYFDYSGDVTVADINSYQYTASLTNIDNGTLDPGNACYCGDDCLPSGVVNMSTCEYGAPTFFSYPHFYQADPYYLDQVEGLAPDKEKHSFHIRIEPTTGMPLDMLIRLQVNLFVQPYDAISLFADLPTMFFPMIWFEQRVTISPELATALQYLLMVSPIGYAVVTVMVVTGLIMAALAGHARWHMKRDAGKHDNIMKQSDMVAPLMVDNTNTTIVVAFSLLNSSQLN